MILRSALAALCLLASGTVAVAQATAGSDPEALPDRRAATGNSDVAEAWLIAPTTRYRHFVLGSDYEAGGLRVRLADGEVLTLMLDERHVFEDRQPRLGDLDGDGRDEIVLVESSVDGGASLAVYGVEDGALRLEAKTAHIGQPNRWLNPVPLADFDGDGRLDVAFVAMPHLVKRLDVLTFRGGELRRLTSVDDVSNHRLGSPHIGMSATGDFDGDGVIDLAVPDGSRTALRLLSFAGSSLREIARLPLDGRADGVIVARRDGGKWTFEVPLEGGGARKLAFPG